MKSTESVVPRELYQSRLSVPCSVFSIRQHPCAFRQSAANGAAEYSYRSHRESIRQEPCSLQPHPLAKLSPYSIHSAIAHTKTRFPPQATELSVQPTALSETAAPCGRRLSHGKLKTDHSAATAQNCGAVGSVCKSCAAPIDSPKP